MTSFSTSFEWYLGQPWEVQQRYARQLAKGLAEARALRDKNREQAQRMLAKRGWRDGR
jgi:hypothetical protein